MVDSNNIKKLEEDFGELLLRKSWAELSDVEREELHAYVSGGAEYDRIRSVLLAAVSAEDSASGLGMPASSRAELMDIFDRERSVTGGGSPPVRRMVTSRRWWLTGAAAAVVLLMVASVWWVLQRPGVIDEPVKSSELAQQLPDPATDTGPPAVTATQEEQPREKDAMSRTPEQKSITPSATKVIPLQKEPDTPPGEPIIAAETAPAAEDHADGIAVATTASHQEMAITHKDSDQVSFLEEDFIPVKQITGTRELPTKPIPTYKGKIPSMSRPVSEDPQLISFLFECR